LLSSLDVAVPAKSADTLIRVAQSRRSGPAPAARRAAAVVAFLVVAAAAAAAYPASPLHRLLVRSFHRTAASSAPTLVPANTPIETKSQALSFVTTPGSPLEIAFEGAGVGGSLDVKVSDGDQVTLVSPTTGASYRVRSNRIVVDEATPARFQLEIPRALGELRVRVGTAVVFQRRGTVMPSTFSIQLDRSNATRQ
jgi:hypothetical protein